PEESISKARGTEAVPFGACVVDGPWPGYGAGSAHTWIMAPMMGPRARDRVLPRSRGRRPNRGRPGARRWGWTPGRWEVARGWRPAGASPAGPPPVPGRPAPAAHRRTIRSGN